ncbi:MAG: type I DNA topoisomerase, partial [Chlamydiia bacterium]|nr:type I DNA topoisomerase [Chlamydiia bacterium]
MAMTKGKTLIIVESPSKIKTLKKFLGDQYILESSVGHIRDLPNKEFGIDIESNFEPTYVALPDKKEVIERLRRAAKQCDTVYLSPDPDREGEAIAWHITHLLPSDTKYKRVAFNSITKDAVLKALASPRELNHALVDAQQARRLLDRIVGYKISPILYRRIQGGAKGGLSAGRVQSVALKLVVDREKEIEAFRPVEYWTITARLQLEGDSRIWPAILHSIEGKRIVKKGEEGEKGEKGISISTKQEADTVLKGLKEGSYLITRVERKEKRRQPAPPFTTSTLQQEASRHYAYGSSKTMQIAQRLYEGIDLGDAGPEGLITYMRTDSVRVSDEAIREVRDFIGGHHGAKFLPSAPRVHTSKKSAQDAHEAVRPTSVARTPESVRRYLTEEQFRLYSLIWNRFVASQMEAAVYDTVSADIVTKDVFLFRATGSVLLFPGFLILYEERGDEEEKGEEAQLPPLQEGQRPELRKLDADQSFTKPPPRFTEASLVKELEKSGIGRPSTYASIMNKIQSREYTRKEKGRLIPTELGRVIVQFLEANFEQIMDVGFTARMEDELEAVAESRKEWKQLLSEFWDAFYPVLTTAEKEAFVPRVETELPCPECGAHLQKIWYKAKYFYGCSRYPECTYSAPVEEVHFDKSAYSEDFDWDQPCPKCGGGMKLRHGKFGAFLGCLTYPACKGIVNIPKKGEKPIDKSTGVKCPAVGCDGELQARRSRFGKIFYSCSSYPDCDVIGNSPEEVLEKYVDHPKTPYVKKAKTKGEKSVKGSSKKVKG